MFIEHSWLSSQRNPLKKYSIILIPLELWVMENTNMIGLWFCICHDCDTLNRDKYLFQYEKDAFDCIVLDEVYHSPANTYQKVMEYFTLRLFLDMTATPDKRDDHLEGRNVYELFRYQIAHEIRLQKAMEDNLLWSFHYFRISDIAVVNDNALKNRALLDTDFNLLISEVRVKHVIEQAEYYGYSGVV